MMPMPLRMDSLISAMVDFLICAGIKRLGRVPRRCLSFSCLLVSDGCLIERISLISVLRCWRLSVLLNENYPAPVRLLRIWRYLIVFREALAIPSKEMMSSSGATILNQV